MQWRLERVAGAAPGRLIFRREREDGSNLVSLTGRQAFASANISGDGTAVGYEITTADGTADVVGVVGAAGAPRELARHQAGQPAPFPTNGADDSPGFPSLFYDRLQLSYDGAWMLLGSTGVLVNTTTAPASLMPYTLQLAMRGGSTTSDPAAILYDGLYRATMNDSATRFLYVASDKNNVRQLATLDLNPGSPGAAPSITNLPHVTNIFVGTLQGDTITGQWVDLPGGAVDSGMGTLTLRVVSNDQMVKIGESNPYGITPGTGQIWIRVSGSGATSTTGRGG